MSSASSCLRFLPSERSETSAIGNIDHLGIVLLSSRRSGGIFHVTYLSVYGDGIFSVEIMERPDENARPIDGREAVSGLRLVPR